MTRRLLLQATLLSCAFVAILATANLSDDEVVEGWHKFENYSKKVVDELSKSFRPYFTRKVLEARLSPKCTASLAKLIADLRRLKAWAFGMFDASGKIGSGIMSGSMSMLGNFDQCLRVRGPKDIRGRYCLVECNLPLPPKPWFYYSSQSLPVFDNFSAVDTFVRSTSRLGQYFYFLKFKFGLCLPSTCNTDDISRLTLALMKDTGMIARLTSCQDTLRDPVSTTQATIISLYAIAVALVIAGTLADLLAPTETKSLAVQVMRAFSAIRNGRKILTTRRSPDSLPALHGLKFLTISWIVLGHTYVTISYDTLSNMRDFLEYGKDFLFQSILNATPSVDTFFVISGLLVAMVVTKLTRELNRDINIPVFIIRRVWRLWPALAAAIGLVFLVPLMGYGPLFRETLEPHVDRCRRNWWASLLFFNNWQMDQCLDPTWFVSADLQLYIVSLAVLIPLRRRPKLGLAINFALILAGVLATGLITWAAELPPTMLFVNPDPDQRRMFWALLYFQPTPHIAPYFIGLATGYLLITKPKLYLSRATVWGAWTASTAVAITILWVVYPWNAGHWVPSRTEAILYAALHRPAWALAICWVIASCHYGYAGAVNTFLSWKVFDPLARLTYCVFLMHYIIQYCVTAQVGYVHGSHMLAVWVFMGTVFITFLLSFFATLVFESPYITLESLLISRMRVKLNPTDKVAPPPSTMAPPLSTITPPPTYRL